jgi:hypothetical protein
MVLNKESNNKDIKKAFSSIFKAKNNNYNNKENNKDKELNKLESRKVNNKRSLSKAKAIIPKTYKTK